jgi:hypothetical protein
MFAGGSLEALGRLTGLMGLSMFCDNSTMKQLLQMTQLNQLKQLTSLSYTWGIAGAFQNIDLVIKVSCCLLLSALLS